jgi:uncharacterized membrane protein YqjE
VPGHDDTRSTPGTRQGLFASLHNLAITLMAMLQTRLELLGNEVEAEKLRILRMLMLVQTLMFTAIIAALLIVALITLWLWELRLGVLGVFSAIFVVGAVLAYRALMQMVQRDDSAFSTSLGELRDDLQRLKQASGNAKTPD